MDKVDEIRKRLTDDQSAQPTREEADYLLSALTSSGAEDHSAVFTAYNQAIEDAKAAIRGETVDDPYAAPTFINAIARKCSPHVYVNQLAKTGPSAADLAYADGYTNGFRQGKQSRQPRETCARCTGSGFETDGVTPCDRCGGNALV